MFGMRTTSASRRESSDADDCYQLEMSPKCVNTHAVSVSQPIPSPTYQRRKCPNCTTEGSAVKSVAHAQKEAVSSRSPKSDVRLFVNRITVHKLDLPHIVLNTSSAEFLTNALSPPFPSLSRVSSTTTTYRSRDERRAALHSARGSI